jgi:hypothetical protein
VELDVALPRRDVTVLCPGAEVGVVGDDNIRWGYDGVSGLWAIVTVDVQGVALGGVPGQISFSSAVECRAVVGDAVDCIPLDVAEP